MSASISQQLSQAYAQHQAGNFAAAQRQYQAVLAQQPKQPDALSLLASLHLSQQQWADSARLFQQALALNAAQPALHYNCGLALQNLAQFDAALRHYDAAIALQPTLVEALHNRANVLYAQGRYDDALQGYAQVLALKPDHLNAHRQQGILLRDHGQYTAALASFNHAILLDAHHAITYCNRGLTLQKLRRLEAALADHQRAAKLCPNSADAQYNLAVALQELQRYDAAIEGYHRVLTLDPQHALAYHNRATCFQAQGQLERAKADIHAAIAAAPNDGLSYYTLTTIYTPAPDSAVFAELQHRYAERANLSLNDQSYLGFALGQVLEKYQRYDEAFHAYAEANRLLYQIRPVDDDAQDALVDNIIARFPRSLFERIPKQKSGSQAQIPIFIVGMPRSGTTLIEQILATQTDLFGAGELSAVEHTVRAHGLDQLDLTQLDTAQPKLHQAGQAYLNEAWQLAPTAHLISDKMPANYYFLGWIKLMLPQAKIIHAMRDPMDSCFSCFALRFGAQMDYAYDLTALGRQYRRYRRLMQHWHDVLPADSILDSHYEQMVTDPEPQARRLLSHLDLPWNESCLKFYESQRAVSTASVRQVRQPIYTTSLARWKRFETHLAPLLAEI
jgi:tetratricopeptide (TPR) repeat protein